MKHLDEDILMKLALDLLDEGEKEILAEHLVGCESCRDRLDSLRVETDMIGSLEPDIPTPFIGMPAQISETWLSLIKIAALLLVGFAAGYGFSQISAPEDLTVVPYYQVVSTPLQTIDQFAVCESVNLGNRN
jgi:hypothetical protein